MWKFVWTDVTIASRYLREWRIRKCTFSERAALELLSCVCLHVASAIEYFNRMLRDGRTHAQGILLANYKSHQSARRSKHRRERPRGIASSQISVRLGKDFALDFPFS